MICLTPPMPDLEQSGIDPDETLPYCDGFPLLGPSSLDGPGTGTKDDGKDSQWGPADEQTDVDNSTKQADPTDFRVPGQDADKSVLGREVRQRHKMGTLSVCLPREGQYGSLPV